MKGNIHLLRRETFDFVIIYTKPVISEEFGFLAGTSSLVSFPYDVLRYGYPTDPHQVAQQNAVNYSPARYSVTDTVG